jgi:hypothetical protein
MLQTLLMPLEQFRNYCGPGKDREEWFSLRENHETACRFDLQQLRNCSPGCGPRHIKLPEFIQEIGTMAFPQATGCGAGASITACGYHKPAVYYSRTLANSIRRDKLFSGGDFPRTLSSILSGEGFDEREQGKSPLEIPRLPTHLRFFCAAKPTLFRANNQ